MSEAGNPQLLWLRLTYENCVGETTTTNIPAPWTSRDLIVPDSIVRINIELWVGEAVE